MGSREHKRAGAKHPPFYVPISVDKTLYSCTIAGCSWSLLNKKKENFVLRKETFIDQIDMYFAVIDAHFKGVQTLDVHKLRSIHHCLDIGTGYFPEHTDKCKEIKKYKLSIKTSLETLYSQNHLLVINQRLQNVDISALYFTLPQTETEGDEPELISA